MQMPKFAFFFLQTSRYVSNKQPCLKTTGLYHDLLLLSSLFHFFYFTFSAPISFSLCFPTSITLLFEVFSQNFIKIVEKYLELWGKKSNIGAFLAFKKFEDNSDMHLDFKK